MVLWKHLTGLEYPDSLQFCYFNMDNNKVTNSLKAIFKGGVITLFGTAAGYLLNFVFKVIAARHFGPEQYGRFSLALAVVVIASSISGMGMFQSVARFIPFFRKRNEPEKIFYTVNFGVKLSLITSLIIGCLLLVNSGWISKQLNGERDFKTFIMFFVLVVPFEVIFDFSLGVLRGMKDMKMMALFNNIILWVVRLLLLGLIIMTGWDVKCMVLPYLASYLVASSLSWTYIIKRHSIPGRALYSSGSSDPSLRKELLTFSLPLVFSTITTMFRKRFDVILVGFFLTATQAGLYYAALPLAMLMTIFLFSINRIAMPIASGLFGEESEKEMAYVYKAIARWSLMVTLPLFFVLFLYPERLISIFFGKEFLEASNALRILSVGFFFNAISGSFGDYLQSYNRTKSILVISVIGTSLNLALMVALIPKFGIEGAAIALAGSLAYMCLLGVLYMHHYKKVLPFSKEYFLTLVIGTFIYAGSYFVFYLFPLEPSMTGHLVFAGVIATMSVIYFAILFFGATDDFDRRILSSIRKRSGQLLQRT